MSSLSRPLVVLLILLAAFLSLDDLGHRKLANPDEGRYSEIAREMAISGDFITPRLNGLKYFEKPPLQYWATALTFRAFGESEFTARLYPALCGLGCILLILFTAGRLYGVETGAYSALALMSGLFFMAMNEVITLDMGLTFWMTLTVCAFLLAQSAATPPARRSWLLLAWAGTALALLSKGLIGPVFPFAALFLYVLIHRKWHLLLQLEWRWGLLVFFLIATPWFVLVSLQNPEFPHFFFIHEHFERFLTTTHRREEPWWFFLPLLFFGYTPWILLLIPAAWAAWRADAANVAAGRFAVLRYIVIFSVFVLFFFSKSGSKLPAYILPLFPLLAIPLGVYLCKADTKRLAWMVSPIIVLALAGSYYAWKAPAARAAGNLSRQLWYSQMGAWVMAAMLALAAAALVAFVAFRYRQKVIALVTLAIGTLLAVEFIEQGYEYISPIQSGYATAQAISPHLKPETRLYAVRIYDQSLPFYLKRTLTLVDYVDEFELGQKQEPAKYLAKLSDFPTAWNAPGPALAMIQPGEVDQFRSMGLAFEVIHQDPRRTVIVKTTTP
ncbi:MAG: glycosyltransferase family 39 protein [Betaproteobacteria bacterium]|nr:glycosyltransferase family 39 protein [Betaproteobacteria bacterium]